MIVDICTFFQLGFLSQRCRNHRFFINLFSGYTEEAAREYQLAADLLFDNEKEQKKYQAKADELKTQATETP